MSQAIECARERLGPRIQLNVSPVVMNNARNGRAGCMWVVEENGWQSLI